VPDALPVVVCLVVLLVAALGVVVTAAAAAELEEVLTMWFGKNGQFTQTLTVVSKTNFTSLKQSSGSPMIISNLNNGTT
jgi:hypothetical protein